MHHNQRLEKAVNEPPSVLYVRLWTLLQFWMTPYMASV